jgi:hypothetical protein
VVVPGLRPVSVKGHPSSAARRCGRSLRALRSVDILRIDVEFGCLSGHMHPGRAGSEGGMRLPRAGDFAAKIGDRRSSVGKVFRHSDEFGGSCRLWRIGFNLMAALSARVGSINTVDAVAENPVAAL